MPIPDKLVIYDDNTQLLQLFGMQQQVPGNPPTYLPVVGATVKATLFDSEMVAVPGCINISLTPIGSPPAGDYSGQVTSLFNPAVGGDYVLVVDGDNGPDHLHIEILVEVKSRRI